MSLSNLTTNNNDIASLEWEIENALTYGAFADYDLVGKLVKKAQLQRNIAYSIPKVVDYSNFPKRVRSFVKSYFHSELEQFPELITHLGTLKVFATERPLHYAHDVGAEYFDNANLVASYIPLDQLFTKYAKGLVHEIVHAVQFFLHNRGQKVATPQNANSKYYSDNKFYLNDAAEVEARKVEAAFNKLSWEVQEDPETYEDLYMGIKSQIMSEEEVSEDDMGMDDSLEDEINRLVDDRFREFTGKNFYDVNEKDFYIRESQKLSWLTQPDEEGYPAYNINDHQAYSLYEQGIPVSTFSEAGDHILVHTDDGWELWMKKASIITRLANAVFKDDTEAQEWLHSQEEQQRSLDASLKLSWEQQPDEGKDIYYGITYNQAYALYKASENSFLRKFRGNTANKFALVHRPNQWDVQVYVTGRWNLVVDDISNSDEEVYAWIEEIGARQITASKKLSWQRDFIRLIEGLEEGQEIWDDGNDEFRVKEINHEKSEVLLEEVFASGNFQGPFWVTEAEMLEYGFYKDPPTSRFRNPESSLKFSWQQHSTFEDMMGELKEGDVIKDYMSDEFSIRSIDYEAKRVSLSEIFPPGTYNTPSWSTEEAMKKRFFYKESALKDKNEQLFNRRYQNYGEDGGNLFWSDKQSQYDRFRLLSDIIELKTSNKASVLDVGAGFGDYLDFLRDYDITIGKYVGIDIIPAIIEVAERKHLEQFEVRDLVNTPYADNSFDYVIGSGLFALDDKDWLKETVELLTVMYNVSRRAVSVNFLTGEAMSDMFKTVTEEEVKKIASLVTKNYKIIKDKISDDITLFLYKGQ